MNKYIKNISFGLLALSVCIPIVSFAALSGVKDLIRSVGEIMNQIIPVIFGLAIIYFFWGLAQFMLKSGESKNHEEGRNKMIWGIIILFVMISIYGILNAFGNLIGIPVPGAGGTNNGIDGNSNLAPCEEREEYYRAMYCPETIE